MQSDPSQAGRCLSENSLYSAVINPLALYYPGGVKSLTPFARLCFPFPPFILRLKKGLLR